MKHRDPIRDYIENTIVSGRLKIDYNDELLMAGILDSLGVMRLLSFIEKELDIHVPVQDVTIENFSTVEIISNYLETR